MKSGLLSVLIYIKLKYDKMDFEKDKKNMNYILHSASQSRLTI
jgi:hypothetical protein